MTTTSIIAEDPFVIPLLLMMIFHWWVFLLLWWFCFTPWLLLWLGFCKDCLMRRWWICTGLWASCLSAALIDAQLPPRKLCLICFYFKSFLFFHFWCPWKGDVPCRSSDLILEMESYLNIPVNIENFYGQNFNKLREDDSMTILAKHQCLQKMRIVSWLGSSADGIRKENDDKIHKEPSRQNPSVNTSPRRTASHSLSLSLVKYSTYLHYGL